MDTMITLVFKLSLLTKQRVNGRDSGSDWGLDMDNVRERSSDHDVGNDEHDVLKKFCPGNAYEPFRCARWLG
jgi:hypothetical protein